MEAPATVGAALDHDLHDAARAELVEHAGRGRRSSSRHGCTLAPAGRRAEHDAQRWLAARRVARTVSVGVVGADGAGADDHGVALGPQPVGVGARRRRR